MKKFIVEISHTEYAKIRVEAKNTDEAEELAYEKIDSAYWGNDETEILNTKEIK